MKEKFCSLSSYAVLRLNTFPIKTIRQYSFNNDINSTFLVARLTEPGRSYRQHSNFAIGLHGQNWVDSMAFFLDYAIFLNEQPKKLAISL